MDYTIQTEHKGNFLEVHDYRNWQSKGATMNGSSGRAKRNPAEDAELLDLSQRLDEPATEEKEGGRNAPGKARTPKTEKTTREEEPEGQVDLGTVTEVMTQPNPILPLKPELLKGLASALPEAGYGLEKGT